jgi:hypothetical protein
VPLFPFVLELLHASSEKTATSIAPGGEIVVMTIRAVKFLVLAGERMIDQRLLAVRTLEAFLVPMTVFVRQVLRIGSDRSLAVFALIGEERLVAFDAEWFLVPQNVSVPDQIQVAVETCENSRCTVRLSHGLQR